MSGQQGKKSEAKEMSRSENLTPCLRGDGGLELEALTIYS